MNNVNKVVLLILCIFYIKKSIIPNKTVPILPTDVPAPVKRWQHSDNVCQRLQLADNSPSLPKRSINYFLLDSQ